MPELRHAGIVVRDLDRALGFWCDGLGFTVASRAREGGVYLERLLGIPGAVATIVKLQYHGIVQLELLEFEYPRPLRPGRNGHGLTTYGLTHVAVTVDSLDVLPLLFLRERVVTSEDGRARIVFTQDPDGTWVELVEPVPQRFGPQVACAGPQAAKDGQEARTMPAPDSEAPDYLAYTYDPARVPYTLYPKRLAAWLDQHWLRKPGGSRLVDFGCGRGEYLAAFYDIGYNVLGVDWSPVAQTFTPFPVIRADVGDVLPVEVSDYDVAFSKSVIEHCRDSVAHLKLMRSVLKKGGIALVLTPDWESQAWGPFYVDPTHVSPFTIPGLRTALELAGFQRVRVSRFTQLPVLWRQPELWPLVWLTAALRLPYRPYHAGAPWPEWLNTWIRFSRERMLLGVGVA